LNDLGLATSFFCDKNRNISHDLANLIVEANQELPEWLEKLSSESQRYNTRGGGRGKGPNRFENSLSLFCLTVLNV
jgi:ATP-dependent RNA helicase DDX3X